MIDPDQRPKLDDVTLVAVTSVALRATLEAIRTSTRKVLFAEVLLLSDQRPADIGRGITWRRIPRLSSRLDYSAFMLRHLADHIETSHALFVQWDGFVLDGGAWRPDFLDYDYIGAPWPHYRDGRNVGNGGFSLRSRRLLNACVELPVRGGEPEDIVISRTCRTKLEAAGIRFAPEGVARSFSYERMKPTGREFGFHGAFNLVRQLPAKDAARILMSLEPGMLARNERWELLRWAVGKRQFRVATDMLRRLF